MLRYVLVKGQQMFKKCHKGAVKGKNKHFCFFGKVWLLGSFLNKLDVPLAMLRHGAEESHVKVGSGEHEDRGAGFARFWHKHSRSCCPMIAYQER